MQVKARRIFLSRRMIAVVDHDDYERVAEFRWTAHKSGLRFYAMRNVYPNGKAKNVKMHRFILGATSGQIVDHINHDTLDNRRANLRVTDSLGNTKNVGVRKDSKSGYKGVYYCKTWSRWKATIRSDNRRYSLGYFRKAEDAARAYDAKAKELHGEFAVLNFADVTAKKEPGR